MLQTYKLDASIVISKQFFGWNIKRATWYAVLLDKKIPGKNRILESRKSGQQKYCIVILNLDQSNGDEISRDFGYWQKSSRFTSCCRAWSLIDLFFQFLRVFWLTLW